ncbi:MAG: hypothetical protein ISR75_05160 [Phycisphaerales bacterium]|nr:hypothetical protein [Planctomycetota bacterium]MBL6997808.1 hypothetical protein [Phycisphaerales bacterium]
MRIITICLLLLLAACGNKEEATNTPASTSETTKTVATTDSNQDNRDQRTISESMSLAGIILDINMKGTLRPNSEYQGEITLVSGTQGATIRLWIGYESGIGSMKYKADGHGDHYHAFAVVPNEINAKTALWIEVQSVTGETETGSAALQ